MYQTDQYEGMIAETVIHAGAQRGSHQRVRGPTARRRPLSRAWCSSTTRRAGTSGTASARAASPTTGTCRSRRTCTSATATALPRTSGPRCARPAARRTPGCSAISMARTPYLRSLPYVSGKIGVFGTCSGGRQAFLAGCRLKGFDAVIDCWGGRVVQSKEELTPSQPVAPIDYTKDLSCPILGLFGNEDKAPTPEQVNTHEAELKKHGKHVRVPPLRRRRSRVLLLRPRGLPSGTGDGRLEEGVRVLRANAAVPGCEEPNHVHDDRAPGEDPGPRQAAARSGSRSARPTSPTTTRTTCRSSTRSTSTSSTRRSAPAPAWRWS